LKKSHNNCYNYFIIKTVKKLIKTIKRENPLFPSLLTKTASCPSLLFYRGELPKQDEICVSIVGTRKASRDGLNTARSIAYELAEVGISIISGLALGIDGSAHEGALLGGGKTYAILANGLNSVYPRQHEFLAENIIKSRGGVISEYPPDTPSYPNQFLERNRIISGMSIATVVIEAPKRSGSLATARLALEEGRDVFVIPGQPLNKNYQGSHYLIRQGARLVTCANDILEDLNIEIKTKKQPPTLTETQSLVIGAFQNTKTLSVDTISELTKLETHIVTSALSFLVLKDIVEEKNGMFTLKR